MSMALLLIETLRKKGVFLAPEGERLAVRTTTAPLSAEERALLRAAKEAVMAILRPLPPRHAGGW